MIRTFNYDVQSLLHKFVPPPIAEEFTVTGCTGDQVGFNGNYELNDAGSFGGPGDLAFWKNTVGDFYLYSEEAKWKFGISKESYTDGVFEGAFVEYESPSTVTVWTGTGDKPTVTTNWVAGDCLVAGAGSPNTNGTYQDTYNKYYSATGPRKGFKKDASYHIMSYNSTWTIWQDGMDSAYTSTTNPAPEHPSDATGWTSSMGQDPVPTVTKVLI